MVKVQLELNEYENKIVEVFKAIHNLEDKRTAIKQMISVYATKTNNVSLKQICEEEQIAWVDTNKSQSSN